MMRRFLELSILELRCFCEQWYRVKSWISKRDSRDMDRREGLLSLGMTSMRSSFELERSVTLKRSHASHHPVRFL